MKLSEHLVKTKTRVTDIGNLKQLNVWGCQITDIRLCLQMPLLEVLSLSNNQICSLRGLENCHNLRHLYLGKNLIESFYELYYLKEVKSLVLLTLKDNPCVVSAGSSYRTDVLRILPQLKTLDDVDITIKEQELLLQERRVEDTDRANYKDHGTAEQEHKTSPSQVEVPQKVAPTMSTFRGARGGSGNASVASFLVTNSSMVPAVSVQQQQGGVYTCCQEHDITNIGNLTAREKAIASASACVDAVTQRREQELKDTISQYYPDAPGDQERDRNASLLMAALALIKQMDPTTLEVLCRAIQDQVLNLPS